MAVMSLLANHKPFRILLLVFLVITGVGVLAILAVLIGFLIADRTNGKLVSSGETRRYLLYVPKTYNAASPVPLVISLHGFAEWPAHQSHVSRWNDVADREGFIVVYPSGTGFPKRWQAFPSGAAAESKDVVFINDLIDRLLSQYNIDPTRVYVNGLSNGGGMSNLLGCVLSERIAAFGSVAGAFLGSNEQCQPTHPMPVIAFHGTADKIVPYNGGPSHSFDIPFPAVTDWIKSWAARNGCDLNPIAIPANGDVSGIRYTSCVAGADVVLYTIAGGGHAWPGGNPIPKWIVGYTSMDISATETMWAFFKQYSLTLP